MAESIRVYLELGDKRVFACSVDWPGWCRSGKTEDAALEALAAYAPRYAPVAKAARLEFPAIKGEDFDVVERLKGTAITDFGVPCEVAGLDRKPLTDADADRLAKLIAASWKILDEVVASAPSSLRKGPRGGGRDRDKIVEHVVGAESGYSRKIGVRLPRPKSRADADTLRAAILEAIRHQVELPEGSRPKPWPRSYAARRIAWHAIDHAWEIEDRTERP